MKKLGFGGMRLPLLREDDPKSIDQQLVNQMVDQFLEGGGVYFDTAYFYHDGCSETAFREGLTSRYARDRYVLADKLPVSMAKEREDYPRIFQEQLQRCGVDYFDYYLLHNINRHNYENTVRLNGFEFMAELKEQGKIRHMGFSFHDTADMLEDILTKYPQMEFVQLQLNYLDWDSSIIQAGKCYETARRHNKQVIVMEPVKGGGLARLPEEAESLLKRRQPEASCASWAFRFAASLDGVMMVLSGMNTWEQMADNLSTFQDFQLLDPEEQQLLKQAGDILRQSSAVPCTSCRYCLDTCPMNLDIPGYFSIYNTYIQFQTLNHHIFQYERQVVGHGKASQCIQCGQCEEHCPQHIAIPQQLKLVAKTFEGE